MVCDTILSPEMSGERKGWRIDLRIEQPWDYKGKAGKVGGGTGESDTLEAEGRRRVTNWARCCCRSQDGAELPMSFVTEGILLTVGVSDPWSAWH